MTARVELKGISIAKSLSDFVESEALPGTGVARERFWSGLAQLVAEFAPRNAELLAARDNLQALIDDYYRARRHRFDPADYERFLRKIGYLLPEPAPFSIRTEKVDDEIARIAGPQLVVPLSNARYALNAANARWGSLYDALYGTDVIPEDGGAARGPGYNNIRGGRVIAYARGLLDRFVPLVRGSHRDACLYSVEDARLTAVLRDGSRCGLAHPEQFAGFQGDAKAPSAVLLRHHGLHLELRIDRSHPVGRDDPAGIADIVLEAAVTTIMDLEDSVAAVDAEDKVHLYRNWLGLVTGNLSASFDKDGRRVQRRLNGDRVYRTPNGGALRLPGRSLMLLRHVGLHMYTDAVLDAAGAPVPEGIVDAAIATLISLHELRGNAAFVNSAAGSLYVVKPKLHGPAEVEFTDRLFARVEDILDLPRHTLKIGIMDEERRTTVNLKACIRAAADRVVFINTGFLDRTGDEIHTSMFAGPMIRKADMKTAAWIKAYEDWNGVGAMYSRHPHFTPAEAREIRRQTLEKEFHTLGPSVLRLIQTDLKGALFLRDSQNPNLQRRGHHLAAKMGNYRAILWALVRLCPTDKMRGMAADTLAEVERHFGHLTGFEKAEGAVLWALGTKQKARYALVGDVIQPPTWFTHYPGKR